MMSPDSRALVLAIAALVACADSTPSSPAPPPTRAPTPTATPTPPQPPKLAPKPGDLIDPTTLDATIALDLRYATDRNFAGEPVYPVARCLLRRAVAERLVAASRAVRARGYRLKLWDCYRPFSVQETFWKKVPDPRYVARPVREDGAPARGSKHNRGAAVDLTLIAADGSDLELPTDHDDFSPRARRGHKSWSKAARRHAAILHEAMTGAGFTGIATEWWHYDGPGWKRYPLSDQPLSIDR